MSLEMNKIAGAVLVGGLVTLLSGIIADQLVQPEVSHVAMAVPEAPAEAQGAAAPQEEALEPVVGLLAAADPAAGETVAKRCVTCHTFEAGGPNKVGPNLWAVVGAPHAHVEGFAYSPAMLALHDQPWTYEDLNHFLASPKDAIPGTKMAFPGLKKVADRAAVIAWLRTKADTPAELPTQAEIDAAAAPEPVATPAAATDGAAATEESAAVAEPPAAETPDAEQTAAAEQPTTDEQPAAESPAPAQSAEAEQPAVPATAEAAAEAPAGAPATTEQPAEAEAPAADEGSPVVAMLASADTAVGEKLAKRCAACHTFTADGADKVGPNLWDIVGAPHAHREGFKYSEAMVALHDQPWTYAALDAYLESPKDAIPGNKMAFAGLKKPEDRAALIAYLRTLSESPQPLP